MNKGVDAVLDLMRKECGAQSIEDFGHYFPEVLDVRISFCEQWPNVS